MAGSGWSLKVIGLPTEVEHDRLIDKLLIHFLRPSNGGGEVLSITVSKGRLRSALVTFEDRKVALGVLSHHPHILELDGQRYELAVSLASPQSTDPDKVILIMSVTVDCCELPLDKRAETSLKHRFPDLHISWPSPEVNQCSLSGPYSQMQAAVAHILQLHENSEGETPRPKTENGFVPTGSQSHQMWPPVESNGPSSLHALGALGSSVGQEVEDLGAEGGAERGDLGLSLPGGHHLSAEEDLRYGAEMEDLSLVMDADLFQYLKKSEEYSRILRDHKVEVVDETSHGFTTLFFQARSKVTGESEVTGRALKNLVRAQKELKQLQQQQEASLRRAQLSKSTLSLRGGLRVALENIQALLPKLLLTQDDENVYIVGESSDVSQAKQLLMLGYRLGKEGVATSTQSPSHSPSHTLSPASSPSDADQRERALGLESTAEDPRLGKMLRTSGGDRKMEYKLAARFKSSGVTLSGLGPKPGDLGDHKDQRDSEMQRLFAKNGTASGNASVTRDKVFPGGAGSDFGALQIPAGERTGEDILFRGTAPQPAAVKATPMSTSAGASLSSLSLQAPFSGKMLPLPGPPPGPSGSGLRRASSFSGRTRAKPEEEKLEGAQAMGSSPRSRARSNSITSGVHTAEVIVPQLMWTYMKEAYRTRLDDMTSDLQLSESETGDDRGVKVILKGAEASVVAECQRELQKLVSMVTSDFSVMELRLSDLGITDEDEVFEACCVDVRSRFKKVSLRMVRGSLFLIGPKLLCSQVDATLREVFPGGMGEKASSQTFPKQPLSSRDSLDPDPSQRGYASSSSDTEKNTNKRKDLKKGERHSADSTHRQKANPLEHMTGGLSLPVAKKEPVIREKVERGATISGRKSKTYTSSSTSAEASQGAVAWRFDEMPTSLPVTLAKGQEFLKQTNLHTSPAVSACICGESCSQLARTACGLNLCRRCMSHHDYCGLCAKKGTEHKHSGPSQEQKTNRGQSLAGQTQGLPVAGIHGTMMCIELSCSLAGYDRDTTAKITYVIPDGIQDEGHPSPGSPFKGGIFEAYLPLSTRGRGFLPRLERAFRKGLTFTVAMGNTTSDRVGKIVWHNIPHKTKMEGGKSGNGFPDAGYLSRLSEALKAHGIEDVPVAMTQDKAKP